MKRKQWTGGVICMFLMVVCTFLYTQDVSAKSAQKIIYDKNVALNYMGGIENDYCSGIVAFAPVTPRTKDGKRINVLPVDEYGKYNGYTTFEGGQFKTKVVGIESWSRGVINCGFKYKGKIYKIRAVTKKYPKLIEKLWINGTAVTKPLMEKGYVKDCIVISTVDSKIPNVFTGDRDTINMKIKLKKGAKIIRMYYSESDSFEAEYAHDGDRYLQPAEYQNIQKGAVLPYDCYKGYYLLAINYKGMTYYYYINLINRSSK